MSYVDKLMQAALDDGRPKKIKIQQGYIWVFCGAGTDNKLNTQVAMDIVKKIGKTNVTAGYAGAYFTLTTDEITEALPPEYTEALKLNNANRVKYTETTAEHKRKRQGAIRNAQMNAAKAFDASDIGKEFTKQIEDTRAAWTETTKLVAENTPALLVKGMEAELRD